MLFLDYSCAKKDKITFSARVKARSVTVTVRILSYSSLLDGCNASQITYSYYSSITQALIYGINTSLMEGKWLFVRIAERLKVISAPLTVSGGGK